MSEKRSGELYVLAATALFCVYLTDIRFAASYQFEEAASFERLLDGSADRPFQFRILTPAIAAGILSVLPVERTPAVVSAVFASIECIALFAVTTAFGALLGRLNLGGRRPDVAAFSMLWVLPFCYLLYPGPKFFYPWDTPAVLFWILTMNALRDGAVACYYALFVAATLNRETSIFFLVLFALSRYEACSRRALAAHLMAQLAIWLGIKAVLAHLFGDNGGAGLFDLKIADNIAMLSEPTAILAVLSACGFLAIPLVLLRRQVGDPFVRRMLYVAPPFVLGMLLVANFWEVRVFAELTPIALLAYFDICSGGGLTERDAARPRH